MPLEHEPRLIPPMITCPACGLNSEPEQHSCPMQFVDQTKTQTESSAITSSFRSMLSSLKSACPTCGAQVEPSVDTCPRDGTVLNCINRDPLLQQRFEASQFIAAGGMGVIFKARSRSLNKIVAIKMMHSNSAGSGVQRFNLEAKAAGLLCHPFIVSVHDIGVTAFGQPFLVMDYVDGQTLSQILKNQGPLSIERFLRTFLQVCEALSHAHDRMVLHRDIKPSNIMLIEKEDGREEIRIMDFGIAKILETNNVEFQNLTRTGDTVGSPIYMSPEQARGQKVDARADLYSLGCVMYEALTGLPPFTGNTALDTMLLHLSEKPMPLREASLGNSFDASLEEIVLRLLQKNPEDRYSSMDALQKDLLQYQSQYANPNNAGKAQPKTVERNARPQVSAYLIALVVLATLALLATLLIPFNSLNKNRQTSQFQPSGHQTDNLDSAQLATAPVESKPSGARDASPRRAVGRDTKTIYNKQENFLPDFTPEQISILKTKCMGTKPVDVREADDKLLIAAKFIELHAWKSAEKRLDEAIAVFKQEHWGKPEDLAVYTNMRADCFLRQKKFDQAYPLYLEVIQILKKAHSDPALLSNAYVNEASYFEAKDDLQSALALREQANQIRTHSKFPARDLKKSCADNLVQIALDNIKLSHPSIAQKNFSKALVTYAQGKTNPSRTAVECAINLADLDSKQKNYNRALELYKFALTRFTAQQSLEYREIENSLEQRIQSVHRLTGHVS